LKAGIINMTTGFFNSYFEFIGWITDWVLAYLVWSRFRKNI
jgi:hypothetical protein